MWVSVYAVMVLGVAGVLAESPHKDKVDKRQAIPTFVTGTTDSIDSTPYPIASVVR